MTNDSNTNDDITINDTDIVRMEIFTIESSTTQQCGFGRVGFTPQAWTELIMRFGKASDSHLFDVLHAAQSAMRRAVNAGLIADPLQFEASIRMEGNRQPVQCMMTPVLIKGFMVPMIGLVE